MWHRLDITGGVVKTRDGRALNPGEMLSANDCRLKPHDTTQLHNDVGTVALANQPTNTIVAGPFYLGYENATDQIMVVTVDATTTYFEVAPVTGGAWSNIQDSTPADFTITGVATEAAVVHRGNEYFVGTDVGNLVIADGVARNLGMAASSTIGSSQITVGVSGSSANTAQYDHFAYFVTEYDSTHDIESPVTLSKYFWIDTAGQYATVNILAGYSQVNSNADKFRIYRVYIGNNGGFTVDTNTKNYQVDVAALKLEPVAGLATEIDLTIPTSYNDTTISVVNPSTPYPLILTDDQAGSAAYGFFSRLTNRSRPEPFDVATIFNDSIVVNDVSISDQVIKYSPPGYPEYFPTPYFMYFPTEHKDTINGLHVVNDRLVVLGTNATSVVTWLPTVAQLTANQGRVVESLTNGSGCVGKRASTKVDTPQGEFVVWVSQRGLEWSNGVQWDDACPDFTSDSLTGTLANVVLVNNKKQYRLELFDGTTRWDFYYHPSLLKGNRLRLLGPHTAPATIIGGVSFEDKYFLASASTVYQGNYSVSSATTTLQLGHIKGDNPFMDLQCEGIGVTHNGTSSTAKARVYGKLNGEARADSGQKSILDMDKDETSEAALAQRGKYLEPEVEVAGAYAWSIGPLWINLGNPEEGANG